jgi:hypothetical protein
MIMRNDRRGALIQSGLMSENNFMYSMAEGGNMSPLVILSLLSFAIEYSLQARYIITFLIELVYLVDFRIFFA